MASRFPRIFLRHTITISPYLSWNTWGPAQTVKGFVDEQASEKFLKAGSVIRKSVQIFLPLESGTWPEGSRVTLSDGRTGYVAGAVKRAGSGLPIPEHWHLFMDFGAVASPAAGETVVLLRKTRIGQDSLGNDRFSTVEVPLTGCAVSTLDSEEDRSQLMVRATVVVPPGTEVTQLDRMRVRGLVYDVVGIGAPLDDPTLGPVAGVQVTIRRTTG